MPSTSCVFLKPQTLMCDVLFVYGLSFLLQFLRVQVFQPDAVLGLKGCSFMGSCSICSPAREVSQSNTEASIVSGIPYRSPLNSSPPIWGYSRRPPAPVHLFSLSYWSPITVLRVRCLRFVVVNLCISSFL